ncbi:MAG: hypothetical protein HY258_02745, partial [Chloroflexi bacterium]|nr:hypothetical protein [Chloroflexota bacterium]
GFALLGVDPIAEIVIFRVLYPATDYGSAMMTVLDWAYFCISGLTIILGVAALLAGIFSALRPKQLDTPSPEQTVKPES